MIQIQAKHRTRHLMVYNTYASYDSTLHIIKQNMARDVCLCINIANELGTFCGGSLLKELDGQQNDQQSHCSGPTEVWLQWNTPVGGQQHTMVLLN